MKRATALILAFTASSAQAANPEWTLSPADVQAPMATRDWLPPPDHPAIGYLTRGTDDAVARLDQALADGKAGLAFDPRSGYLRALLAALKVPEDSQLLVFSRTSLQRPHISPQTPRAIYFNDRVAVAFIKDAPFIEISVQDKTQGRTFYVLDQKAGEIPRFDGRTDECLNCHLSRVSMGVPGAIDRSVAATITGRVIARLGSSTPDHRTPLAERWGGWYVTGAARALHGGNKALSDDDIRAPAMDIAPLLAKLPERGYPSGRSDAAAHLVFDHQMQMGNLLTRIGWDARIAMEKGDAALTKALLDNDARDVADYMLFVDEAPLTPVEMTPYATAFSAQGPRDGQGRGLHQLDLKTRLLAYPCSYMIYSEAFDALPRVAREAVYARMVALLDGGRVKEAQAVREILTATKPSFKAFVQARRAS
ncbi:MAG: hypothetical protein K1X51_15410 [Rhodospirillaceae bacterium]|nr:hypothetical protein [Rhodospirillaceae bacterium]